MYTEDYYLSQSIELDSPRSLVMYHKYQKGHINMQSNYNKRK